VVLPTGQGSYGGIAGSGLAATGRGYPAVTVRRPGLERRGPRGCHLL